MILSTVTSSFVKCVGESTIDYQQQKRNTIRFVQFETMFSTTIDMAWSFVLEKEFETKSDFGNRQEWRKQKWIVGDVSDGDGFKWGCCILHYSTDEENP